MQHRDMGAVVSRWVGAGSLLGGTARRACWSAVMAALVLSTPAWAQTSKRMASDGVFVVPVRQASTATVTVEGTYSGTLAFGVTGRRDGVVATVDCATPAAPGTAINSTTAEGVWVCPVAGMAELVVTMSGYASGSATVYVATAPSPGQTVAAAGGGGSFDGVLLDAPGGDATTDTVNNAIRVNVVAGAGSGGTAMTDDAAFTPATTNVTPAGAVFDDVAPDSVNEGDGGAVRMSANRNLYSTIRDAAGNERGANVNASNQLEVAVGNTVTVAAHAVTNAGTFATQVDGAALTALQLIDNIPITIGSTTSGQSGALMMGAVSTSAPTYTNAQSHPLSLTPGGLLRVAVEAGGGTGGTSSSIGSAFPATATAVGFSDGTNMQGARAFDADSGAGSQYVLGTNLRFAASGGSVEAFTSSNPGIVAGAVTPGDGASNPTNAVPMAAYLMSFNGTTWDRAQGSKDACDGGTKVFVAISQTTSTQLFAGTASNKTHVCSVTIVQPSASTQTYSLVSGTGSVCATGTAAMIGATTAANGLQQPFSAGAGSGTIAKSAANADNVCLLQSGTDRLTGVIGYVVAP